MLAGKTVGLLVIANVALAAGPRVVLLSDDPNSSQVLQMLSGAQIATGNGQNPISYVEHTGPLFDPNRYPEALKENLNQYLRQVAKILKETARPSDGKKIYLYVSDNSTPNASYLNLSSDDAIVSISRGLLEIAPSDDSVAAVFAHELAHPASKLSREAQTADTFLHRIAFDRIAESEVDNLGLARVIEQGRNPWAMIDLFDAIEPQAKAYAQANSFSLSHADTEFRKDAIAAQIVGRIRKLGQLGKFRLRETSISDKKTVEFGKKEVFGHPDYGSARAEIVARELRWPDVGYGRNLYQRISRWARDRESPEALAALKDVQGVEHWFNLEVMKNWAKLQERLSGSLPASEKLKVLTQVNARVDAEWTRVRTSELRMAGEAAVQSPEVLAYLTEVDNRKYLVDFPNPMEARAYQLANSRHLEKLKKQLTGVQGLSAGKRATLEAEIRLTETAVAAASRDLDEALSVYTYAPGSSRETVLAQLDDRLHSLREDPSEVAEYLRSYQVADDFNGATRSGREFSNTFRYRRIFEDFGLQLNSELHDAFMSEMTREAQLYRSYLPMLSNPDISSRRLAEERLNLYFGLPYDEMTLDEYHAFVDGFENRVAREIAEAKKIGKSVDSSSQLKFLDQSKRLFESYSKKVPGTTKLDEKGAKALDLNHPHVASVSGRIKSLIVTIVDAADHSMNLDDLKTLKSSFEKLIPDSGWADVNRASQAIEQRILEREIGEAVKPFAEARSLSELKSELDRVFRVRMHGRNEMVDVKVREAATAAIQRMVNLRPGTDIGRKEAGLILEAMAPASEIPRASPESYRKAISIISDLSMDSSFASSNPSVFDFNGTARLITHAETGSLNPDAFPKVWEIFSKRPELFQKTEAYLFDSYEYKEWSDRLDTDGRRLKAGVEKYIVEQSARSVPPRVDLVVQLLEGGRNSDDGYHWGNFWPELFDTRLKANAHLSRAQRIEAAVFETLAESSTGDSPNMKLYGFKDHLNSWIASGGPMDESLGKPSKVPKIVRDGLEVLSNRFKKFDTELFESVAKGIERATETQALKTANSASGARDLERWQSHTWPHFFSENLIKNEANFKRAPPEVLAAVLEKELRYGSSYGVEGAIEHLMKYRSQTAVARVLENPALLKGLTSFRLQRELAAWQMERQPSYRSLQATLKSGSASAGQSAVRPDLVALKDFIVKQYPEPGLEREAALDAVESRFLATAAESDVIAGSRLRANYEKIKGIEFADAMVVVQKELRDAKDSLKLIRYLIGDSSSLPVTRKKKFVDREFEKHSEKLRKMYRELGSLQRSAIISAFLSESTGVLSDASTRQELKEMILKKRATDPVASAVFDSYLKVVHSGEAKILLSGIVANMEPKSKTGIQFSRLLNATGPLGAKGAQAGAQTGALDAETRLDLNTVHENVDPPPRRQITADVQKALGKNADHIVSIGKLKNAGSVNYLVEVSVRNPKTRKVEDLLLRLQKPTVGERVFNENLVWKAVATDLDGHSDPIVRRAGRVIEEVRSQTWANLQPNGRELDMSYEAQPVVRSAANEAYTSSKPHPTTGFKSKIVEARDDLNELLASDYRQKAAFVPNIEFTKWEDIKDTRLRSRLAKQIMELEFDAAIRGVFDQDGHKGNWLVDLKTKTLHRPDYAQMNTVGFSTQQSSAYLNLLKGLIDPRKPGSRELESAVDLAFDQIFEIENGTPEMRESIKRKIRETMAAKTFPGPDRPLDRLLALESAAKSHISELAETIPSPQSPSLRIHGDFRKLLASMHRISSYSEFTGPLTLSSIIADRSNFNVTGLQTQLAYHWAKGKVKSGSKNGFTKLKETVAETRAASSRVSATSVGMVKQIGQVIGAGCSSMFEKLKRK